MITALHQVDQEGELMEEVEAVTIIWEEQWEKNKKDVVVNIMVDMFMEEEAITTGIITIKTIITGLTSQMSQGILLRTKNRY